jgi:hypothetical protein
MQETLIARTAHRLSGIDYAPGEKFTVIAEGASLIGWTPTQDACEAWTQQLHVGDLIECTGFGFGDGRGFTPGFGVEWSSAVAHAARAFHVTVSPDQGGPWAHHPVGGFLRPVSSAERAAPTVPVSSGEPAAAHRA